MTRASSGALSSVRDLWVAHAAIKHAAAVGEIARRLHILAVGAPARTRLLSALLPDVCLRGARRAGVGTRVKRAVVMSARVRAGGHGKRCEKRERITCGPGHFSLLSGRAADGRVGAPDLSHARNVRLASPPNNWRGGE